MFEGAPEIPVSEGRGMAKRAITLCSELSPKFSRGSEWIFESRKILGRIDAMITSHIKLQVRQVSWAICLQLFPLAICGRMMIIGIADFIVAEQ
jgi:hypothetical protein